jgi:hypothetical protein
VSAQALRLAGLAGILGVAAIRALVLIEPSVWFADVDPSADAMPLLALGAAGSHVLDLVLVIASALALVGEWRAGRGIHGWLVLCALLPAPVVLLHGGLLGAGNAFRGDTWLAALCAFAALAHLVRERSMRVIALSVLAALTAMLATRGAVQVLVEHPATVALYEETRSSFLADRGWLPDSSAALTYERRLRQPEASGWFGLSNPFSTMMGVGVLALAGLAVLARRGQQAGNTALLALGAAACAALLALNGGKGAIAATLLGAGVLVALLRTGRSMHGAWIFVLCALALLAVLARGAIGTALSEKSLLFRSYYLDAGWTLLRDRDFRLIGTGPDQLQQFFAAAKPPQCPEDVKSLHSVFADWVVTLGVSGVAWIVALIAGFSGKIDDREGVAQEAQLPRLALWIALAAGSLATVMQAAVESPTVDAFWIITRTIGLAAFAMIAAIAAQACAAVSARALAALAFSAAVIVLVHAQIETVAWMPGSCVLALALVAAGSTLAPGSPTREKSSAAAVVLAVPLFLVAASGIAIGAISARHREATVVQAAALLTPLAAARGTDAARTTEFRAQEIEARIAAAKLLDGIWNYEAKEDAVRQWLAVAALSPDRADEALEAAWKIANDRVVMRGPRSALLRADIALARLRLGKPEWIATEEAVGVVAAAAQSQASNPRRWIECGIALEVYWQRFPGSEAVKATFGKGSPLEARAAYEKALAINERLALDPLAQLSDREIAFVRAAIERVTPAN